MAHPELRFTNATLAFEIGKLITSVSVQEDPI